MRPYQVKVGFNSFWPKGVGSHITHISVNKFREGDILFFDPYAFTDRIYLIPEPLLDFFLVFSVLRPPFSIR